MLNEVPANFRWTQTTYDPENSSSSSRQRLIGFRCQYRCRQTPADVAVLELLLAPPLCHLLPTVRCFTGSSTVAATARWHLWRPFRGKSPLTQEHRWRRSMITLDAGIVPSVADETALLQRSADRADGGCGIARRLRWRYREGGRLMATCRMQAFVRTRSGVAGGNRGEHEDYAALEKFFRSAWKQAELRAIAGDRRHGLAL